MIFFVAMTASIIFGGCSNEIQKDAIAYIEVIKKAGFEGKKTDPVKIGEILNNTEVRDKGLSIRKKYSEEEYAKFWEVFDSKFRKEFGYGKKDTVPLLFSIFKLLGN